MQTNSKGQNLIHVLARNAHLIADVNDIIKFYKQLEQRGLPARAKDDNGNTALHHALRAQNLSFIKFLVDVQNFNINETNLKGRNALAYLLCGDNILTAKPEIMKYLISKGANIN